MECAPAFNYARSPHTTELTPDFSADPINAKAHPSQEKALFSSPEAKLSLDLRCVSETTAEYVARPEVNLQILDLKSKGHLGPGVSCDLILEEGQAVWYFIPLGIIQNIIFLLSARFVLRVPPSDERALEKLQPTKERADSLGVPLEGIILSVYVTF
jgi:hypothetical protein